MEEKIKESHDYSTLVIEPHGNIFDLKFKEVWRYRDLLMLLVRRDFVAFYKQTILGPLWFFIQPLFTTIIYTFIFGSLANLSSDNIPGPLFYMAGITAWNYFADCLIKTSTIFKDNADVFGKVYFPRLIIPLSIVMSNLVRFGVQMILFIVMILYWWAFKGFAFHLNIYILLFPALVLLMALLGLGLGMITSALTTKYRDLAFLVAFGVQLLQYATTVVYPLSEPRLAKYRWLIKLNPMTPIIEAFRYMFLGDGTFTMLYLGYSALIIITIVAIGVIIFNKVERTFIDTV